MMKEKEHADDMHLLTNDLFKMSFSRIMAYLKGENA